MQARPRMRCFIGLAFDKSDVDTLYSLSIKPLLKAKMITPRRVDEIQHNEEITVKIREEINTADFAIIDLTYTRPSVYYEGGYAERKIPVIYTVRKDHLDNRGGKENLQFYVHFDLRGRNIIAWRNESDARFKKTLHKRLNHVIKPLEKKAKREEVKEKEEMRYRSLSTFEKRLLNHKYLKRLISQFKSKIIIKDISKDRIGYSSDRDEFLLTDHISCFHVFTAVMTGVSKREMQAISVYHVFSSPQILEKYKSKISRWPRNIIRVEILLVINKVNINLFAELAVGFKRDKYKKVNYLYTLPAKNSAKNKKGKPASYNSDLLIIIDNISSEHDLKEKVSNAGELMRFISTNMKVAKKYNSSPPDFRQNEVLRILAKSEK